MIRFLLLRRQRKQRQRYERIAAEVRASFSSSGGRAAQRKAKPPVLERARQVRDELGLGEDGRLGNA